MLRDPLQLCVPFSIYPMSFRPTVLASRICAENPLYFPFPYATIPVATTTHCVNFATERHGTKPYIPSLNLLGGGIYYTRVVHRLNNEFTEDIQVVL
jgi:hypothetical protein